MDSLVLHDPYIFLVNLLGALVHAIETLAHDRQHILLRLYRLQHVVLNALDAFLVQVLKILEHRWKKVIVILVLEGGVRISMDIKINDSDYFGRNRVVYDGCSVAYLGTWILVV